MGRGPERVNLSSGMPSDALMAVAGAVAEDVLTDPFSSAKFGRSLPPIISKPGPRAVITIRPKPSGSILPRVASDR